MEEDTRDKSEVEREHFKRVKEQMAAEEEALKSSRIVKGADSKKYKKFKEGFFSGPEMELPDEIKLKIARYYQFLNALMGFTGICIVLFIISNPAWYLSVFDSFAIVLNVYRSMLYISLFKDYFVLDINLILLGCAMIAASIVGIIHFQHKHDKISDRISSGRSIRTRIKRVVRKYHAIITLMGIIGIGMFFGGVHCLRQHIQIFDNFIVFLDIYDSILNLSILKSLIIKTNLILMGLTLSALSAFLFALKLRH